MRIHRRWLFVALLLPMACLSQDVKIGDFPDISQLETSLQRGISTRADVIALLGEPNGSGSFAIPIAYRAGDSGAYRHGPGEVLMYQDIETGSTTDVGGVILIDMQQRVLLVFVSNDMFDGFMWYSNTGVGEAQAQ